MSKSVFPLVSLCRADVFGFLGDECPDGLEITDDEVKQIADKMGDDEDLFDEMFWSKFTDSGVSAMQSVLAKKLAELEDEDETE